MKCVIFCGGKGTRLREETEFKPKPLVEVGGYPIIWHIMKIYSHYGVNEFVLPLGYKGEMIKRYFMEYNWRNYDFTLNMSNQNLIRHNNGNDQENWKITFAETGLESKTARRLFRVKQYLKDEENFCLTYGDGLSNVDIKKLIEFHKKNGKIITITGLHPHSKYGLMVTNNKNEVVDFKEKPILKDTINGGFMVINKKIFNYLDDEDTMMVETILPKLAKIKEVIIYHFEGFWQCMDTYRDFQLLNKIWGENPPWKYW